jgi:predicted N-acetyltransferase YhbS
MDLIAEYPNQDTVFIGLFMVNRDYCNQKIGSNIIEKCLLEFKKQGYYFVRLGYVKGNPQSESFWKKCQFEKTGIETDNGQGTVVVLQRKL